MMYSPSNESNVDEESVFPRHHSSDKLPLHETIVREDDYWDPDQNCCSTDDCAVVSDQRTVMGYSRYSIDESYRSSPESVYSANPQCPSDDNALYGHGGISGVVRARSVGKSFPLVTRRFPCYLVGFVVVGLCAIYTSIEAVNGASEHVSLLERNRERIMDKLLKTEKDLYGLRREITAVEMMGQRQLQRGPTTPASPTSANGLRVATVRELHELNALQKRLQLEAQQAEYLKHKVQAASLAEVNEKYGVGVHRVEIQLVFPDAADGPNSFVIELAPLELMPHAIHTFLEMVSTGLLDGCSFILNALHVIKAAPLPYDGSSAKEKAKAFSEHGLESVSFREYTDSYPHKKFTVGFAADGSPSFYINTEDNSEIHQGDPCFGKVVAGFDTIARLEASPTRNGIWFERRIGIKKARILDDDTAIRTDDSQKPAGKLRTDSIKR